MASLLAMINVLTGYTVALLLIYFDHFGSMCLSIYTLVLKMVFGSIVGAPEAFRFAKA